MAPDPAITGFTDQLVADCGLDTASIFFCTGTGPAAAIAYVHHVNVSAAAQHSYINPGVFRSDPFIQLTHAAVAADGSGFIRWGDRRLDPLADQLPPGGVRLSSGGACGHAGGVHVLLLLGLSPPELLPMRVATSTRPD